MQMEVRSTDYMTHAMVWVLELKQFHVVVYVSQLAQHEFWGRSHNGISVGLCVTLQRRD
jgi:hypothetical protein